MNGVGITTSCGMWMATAIDIILLSLCGLNSKNFILHTYPIMMLYKIKNLYRCTSEPQITYKHLCVRDMLHISNYHYANLGNSLTCAHTFPPLLPIQQVLRLRHYDRQKTYPYINIPMGKGIPIYLISLLGQVEMAG